MQDFTLRNYREGDEEQAAALCNQDTARFVGPFLLTPEQWLAQYRRTWRSPGLDEDPECVRVAEREGRLVGYCAADYTDRDYVLIQDLCAAEGPKAEAIVVALLEDAEARGRARGKTVAVLQLPDEDGLARGLTESHGYAWGENGAVFMAAVTDLGQFLTELRPELERRLRASAFADWSGTIRIASGELRAGLSLRAGEVEVASVSDPTLAVEVAPETLPLLLLGRTDVGQAYLQDALVLRAEDRLAALRLLDALFPRLPMSLPAGQWW